MVLDIFRGLNGGPYMHSIHFSFSLGAFLAPLAVAPFLSTKKSVVKALEANGTKEEDVEEILEGLGSDLDTKIGFYYPAVGLAAMLVSLGFLYFTVRPAKLLINPTGNADTANKSEDESSKLKKMSFNLKMLVLLLVIFFFAYVGIEYVYAIYLTAFAVSCKLSLTKLQGARLAAIYWANFALMRFLAIFAAVALNPAIIMLLSFVLCLVGGLALVIYAEESLLLLQVINHSGCFCP